MAKPEKAPVSIQERLVSSLAVATWTTGGKRKYTRGLTRRLIAVLLVTATFALVHLAEAQQAKKVASIGYLSNGSSSSESTRSNAVRLALREFGYIEGQNISIAYRYAEAKAERYPDLVTDLVGIKVDVIVVAGGSATVRAAMKGTKTIPIVMIGSGADPATQDWLKASLGPAAMKFEFVINLQTAKKMGLTINTDVLARATKIIK